jgi:hypothetical protein
MILADRPAATEPDSAGGPEAAPPFGGPRPNAPAHRHRNSVNRRPSMYATASRCFRAIHSILVAE